MKSSFVLSVICALCTLSFAQDSHLTNRTTPGLNLTSITAHNGESVFECWQVGLFKSSPVPGIAGALALDLGDMANATYSVIPGRFNGGLHNAPVPQLVAFASGLVHLTLPNSTDEAWVFGGKYGLIYAEDTKDVSELGHITTYPSADDVIVLAVPLAPGRRLHHTVLHCGPCTWEDMTGL